MDIKEIERLRYRRQYLLTPEEIECPFIHTLERISKSYILYAHIDLQVAKFTDQGITIILLGDIFDYEFPQKNNLEILHDLHDIDFEHFIEKSHRYSGRYVILFVTHDNMIISHDATAARKVYYCNYQSQIWFASQPHLLAKVLHLEKTTDESKLAYYNSSDFTRLFNSNIGNTTYYDDINQLIPNHLYNVDAQRAVRFWPNKKIKYLPVSEVASKCAVIIQGYAQSIVSRYKIMLPLTGGKDSRMLFAATKDYRNEIYYYLNKEPNLDIESPDIRVSKALLTKQGLELHLLYPKDSIDLDFEKVYYSNNSMGSKFYLPFIYNYYLNFSDRVNLPGNIASAAFEVYRFHKLKVTPDSLIRLNKIQKYPYALKYYTEWLDNCKGVCSKYNINLLNLFYWEERLANWGTQIQIEKDIAQEDFNLFNSRLLVTYFLSVKPRYIMIPDYILQKEIIRILWADALSEPINPTLVTGFKRFLHTIRLLELLYKIRFKIYGLGWLNQLRNKISG